jgi:hypothetical protein
MRCALSIVAAVVAAGCVQPPIPAPAPAPAAEVKAPFEMAWHEAVAFFAERNIAMRSTDKAAGVLVSEPVVVLRSGDAWSWARCVTQGRTVPPDRATYDVRVAGDEARATVAVTARFTQGGRPGDPQLIECQSTGAWEAQTEREIAARAERRATRVAGSTS